MRVFSSTSTPQFIDDLRDVVIKAGLGPLVVDQVDQLRDLEGKEAEIEKLGEELTDMEAAKTDLWEELDSLCRVVDQNLDPEISKPIETALKIALAALERHGT